MTQEEDSAKPLRARYAIASLESKIRRLQRRVNGTNIDTTSHPEGRSAAGSQGRQDCHQLVICRRGEVPELPHQLRVMGVGELFRRRSRFDYPERGHAFRKGISFGLPGLRERVHLLGGTLAIRSKPGAGGTRIQVSLPLDPGPGNKGKGDHDGNSVAVTQ